MAQSDKMGTYHLFGSFNEKPAYQHESGLDYLYYAEGDAWVIGATFGGSRVGIVNFDKNSCPYVIRSTWRHSVGGKLEKDPGIVVTCTDPRPILKVKTQEEQSIDLLSAPSVNENTAIDTNALDQADERIDVVTPLPTTTEKPKTTTFKPNITGIFLNITVFTKQG